MEGVKMIQRYEKMSPFRSLSIKDLMNFYDCSKPTAIDRKNELRTASKRNKVRVYDLANFECISCVEVFKAIQGVK